MKPIHYQYLCHPLFYDHGQAQLSFWSILSNKQLEALLRSSKWAIQFLPCLSSFFGLAIGSTAGNFQISSVIILASQMIMNFIVFVDLLILDYLLFAIIDFSESVLEPLLLEHFYPILKEDHLNRCLVHWNWEHLTMVFWKPEEGPRLLKHPANLHFSSLLFWEPNHFLFLMLLKSC